MGYTEECYIWQGCIAILPTSGSNPLQPVRSDKGPDKEAGCKASTWY